MTAGVEWFLFASWCSSASSDNIHGEQRCWMGLPTLRLEVSGWGRGAGWERWGERGELEDGGEEGGWWGGQQRLPRA